MRVHASFSHNSLLPRHAKPSQSRTRPAGHAPHEIRVGPAHLLRPGGDRPQQRRGCPRAPKRPEDNVHRTYVLIYTFAFTAAIRMPSCIPREKFVPADGHRPRTPALPVRQCPGRMPPPRKTGTTHRNEAAALPVRHVPAVRPRPASKTGTHAPQRSRRPPPSGNVPAARPRPASRSARNAPWKPETPRSGHRPAVPNERPSAPSSDSAGIRPLRPARRSGSRGKSFAETHERCRNAIAGDHERHGQNDRHESRDLAGAQVSPKTVIPKNTAVTGSSAPRMAVGVEPMYWMAPVVQRNDTAVGKTASASRHPHRYQRSGRTSCVSSPCGTRRAPARTAARRK